jgi:hypothetical protein
LEQGVDDPPQSEFQKDTRLSAFLAVKENSSTELALTSHQLMKASLKLKTDRGERGNSRKFDDLK